MSNSDKPLTEVRPWGSFTILYDGQDCKVKQIVIEAGQRISLQLHHKREEYWIITAGQAHLDLGEGGREVFPGDTVFVPRGVKHRLTAHRSTDVTFIEVQRGTSFDERDIERFEDDYGRIP